MKIKNFKAYQEVSKATPKITVEDYKKHIKENSMKTENHWQMEYAKLKEKYDKLQEENEELKDRLKILFSRYYMSEGCGCCEDTEPHRDAEIEIGKILGAPKNKNGGYDWYGIELMNPKP